VNTGAVWYHDLRVDYTIHKYNFYVGVDNLFNRLPPLGLTGAGNGSGIYDNFGRTFYAGAVIDLK
jgi:outer membrane receptor protein involved in Fe transport